MKLFVAAKGIVLRDQKMLIIREATTYLDGTETGKWDVPGGRIEPHEPVLVGLSREILEESGLQIDDPYILDVQETFPTIHDEVCHIIRLYFVTGAREGEVKLGTDHDSYLWIDPRDHNAHQLMEDLHDVCETYLQMKPHNS